MIRRRNMPMPMRMVMVIATVTAILRSTATLSSNIPRSIHNIRSTVTRHSTHNIRNNINININNIPLSMGIRPNTLRRSSSRHSTTRRSTRHRSTRLRKRRLPVPHAEPVSSPVGKPVSPVVTNYHRH